MELSTAFYHFIADFTNAFAKPLAPYFIEKFGLDNKTFASLIALLGGITSLVQIFFGAYFDKKSRDGLYIVFIVVLELIFISFLGIFNSFFLTFLIITIVRLLNSAFHPVSAGFAGRHNKGKNVAFFSIAGTFGAALGPVFITSYVKYANITELYFVTIPLIFITLLFSGKLLKYKKEHNLKHKKLSIKGDLFKLLPIFALVTGRSFSMDVFHTYIPIYMNEVSKSLVIGGSVLTMGMIFGVITNYLGTMVLEKTNEKLTNSIGLVGMAVSGLSFVFIPQISVKVLMFILYDGFSFFTMSSNIVAAQKLLPGKKALASSISMGFSWAIGSFLSSGYSAIFGNNVMFMMLSASFSAIIVLITYHLLTVKIQK
ncbi:MFS transporter [Thermosipho ferrireducens]|uniref:MFS transporter n=1 Tax=Thermosipho ferrireducens TaxID=2571116 RepID=A0ABX7S5R7_9BACT|nr:MFS transporter [Thermosipho ferrireducens]QTA37146.1 MFS transporter [Thermosipho ferrireducens]